MKNIETRRRNLSEAELEVVCAMFERKQQYLSPHGYVTLTRDFDHGDFRGKEGQTLKIVMVSRFDDFGLTADLSRERGYEVRIQIDSDLLMDIRLTIERHA